MNRKKIIVGFTFEVHQFVEIYVDKLVDYFDETDEELINVVEKCIINNDECYHYTIDSLIDGNVKDCSILYTLEGIYENDEYYDDDEIDDFTFEELKKLKIEKKYNL